MHRPEFGRAETSRVEKPWGWELIWADTELYVGHVPGWPGAHSQGATLDELSQNLREVVEMLLEDGEPKLETEFVGVQIIQVA